MSSHRLPSLINLSPRVEELRRILLDFVENECIPSEALYHSYMESQPLEKRWSSIPPIMSKLKTRAKSLGLWNLFLHREYKEGPGFTNLEYAVMCEIIGKCHLAAEATNTAAPDTGNMEVLAKYGSVEQKERWLRPLMAGEIRSAFAMTEPGVASSDATNIQLEMRLEGSEYVLNGEKWWISGAGDPRCALYIVAGKTDAGNADPYKQQSILLVPASAPGIEIIRPMLIFGYDDAPHGHMHMKFTNVRVPASSIVLGPGRGFEIMQGRLGPGRIHHCMRAIGMAERALEYHIVRLCDPSKKAFGRKMLGMLEMAADSVAQSRLEIDQARMIVLDAAAAIDKGGAKKALKQIGIAKIVVPQMALNVIDRAIQAHGGAGVCQDFPLAFMYAMMRTLRIADGPDEVHRRQLARVEMRRGAELSRLHLTRPASKL